jgi:hypothetical protein
MGDNKSPRTVIKVAIDVFPVDHCMQKYVMLASEKADS